MFTSGKSLKNSSAESKTESISSGKFSGGEFPKAKGPDPKALLKPSVAEINMFSCITFKSSIKLAKTGIT